MALTRDARFVDVPTVTAPLGRLEGPLRWEEPQIFAGGVVGAFGALVRAADSVDASRSVVVELLARVVATDQGSAPPRPRDTAAQTPTPVSQAVLGLLIHGGYGDSLHHVVPGRATRRTVAVGVETFTLAIPPSCGPQR